MPVGNMKIDPLQQQMEMVISNSKPKTDEEKAEDRSDMLFSYMNMIAFNNKVVCTEILKHHIRFAENYFIINKGVLHDFENGPVDYDKVYERLVKEGNLFIKPFAMGKGNGVHRLSSNGDALYIDDRQCDKSELIEYLKKLDGYIICECMKQHHYSDEIYDKTVNTIRFITMRDTHTHEMKVFFAVQRIGTSKTIPVDNGSKGGLVAKIDLETGKLSEARCLKDLGVFKVHPDSGKPIEGVKPGPVHVLTALVCRPG